jgi:hypothetical protein
MSKNGQLKNGGGCAGDGICKHIINGDNQKKVKNKSKFCLEN